MRAVRSMIGVVAALALAWAMPVMGFAAEDGFSNPLFGGGLLGAPTESVISEEREPQPIPGRALVPYRVDGASSATGRFREAESDAAPLSGADLRGGRP